MKVEFIVRLNLTLSPVNAVMYHDLRFIMARGEKVMILSLLHQRQYECDICESQRKEELYALNFNILSKCSFTPLKAQSLGKCC